MKSDVNAVESNQPEGNAPTLPKLQATGEWVKATGEWVTEHGFRVACYLIPLEQIPADFFADPDGRWTHELLAKAAGFDSRAGVAIGALKEPFNGHPDGAAVVTLNAESRPYVAVIECPIAYVCVEAEAELRVSAA